MEKPWNQPTPILFLKNSTGYTNPCVFDSPIAKIIEDCLRKKLNKMVKVFSLLLAGEGVQLKGGCGFGVPSPYRCQATRNGSISVGVGCRFQRPHMLSENLKNRKIENLESRFGRVGEGEFFVDWTMFFEEHCVRCFVWHCAVFLKGRLFIHFFATSQLKESFIWVRSSVWFSDFCKNVYWDSSRFYWVKKYPAFKKPMIGWCEKVGGLLYPNNPQCEWIWVN